MTHARFVEWSRTDLDAAQRGELVEALTSAQQHCLRKNGYAWLERAGVIWTPPDGLLRRARFTHSASFETRHGSFRIDSEGRVQERSGEHPSAR
jgi:hypothetical protein